MFYVIVSAKLMVENVIYFRSGISICVDVNLKIQQNLMYAKKIILVES